MCDGGPYLALGDKGAAQILVVALRSPSAGKNHLPPTLNLVIQI